MSVPHSMSEIRTNTDDLMERIKVLHDEVNINWLRQVPQQAAEAVGARVGNPMLAPLRTDRTLGRMRTEAILAEAIEHAALALDTARIAVGAIADAAKASPLIEEDRW